MKLHVVLVAPEIAPNTGNIIRLCANTGAALHLVEPLGFSLDDKLLRRGGLDYHEFAEVQTHKTFEAALAGLAPGRVFTFGSSQARRYDSVDFRDGDVLVFGAERAGLPDDVFDQVPESRRLTIPMRPNNRSLNLANAVSVVVFEAWRQWGFAGAAAEAEVLTSETPGSRGFDS